MILQQHQRGRRERSSIRMEEFVGNDDQQQHPPKRLKTEALERKEEWKNFW
ncbi:hypothetical protein KI387_015350, partial [Taxus chinensis]